MNSEKMFNFYKQAYEDLELLLNNCFDLITFADNKGVLTRVSKSCELYFGLAEEDIIGSNVFDLEKKGTLSTSVTAKILKNGKKTTLIQKTGANKHLMVTGFPNYDGNGNIKSIINISKDITETTRLNSELNQIQSELDRIKEEFSRRERLHNNNDIIYRSKPMLNVINLINHVSSSDANILLLGETGVGKNFMAKIIHNLSGRDKEPFVIINCGAIPDNLLESELFGYEQGAFTGALKTGKKGYFELAGKGTIVLDEIGDLPLLLQVKLLHVMDSREVFRIGAIKAAKLNARIIAATNKDLKEMVKEGKFREDLFYRLNVMPITIPPLRERKEDIPGLVRLFLDKFNSLYKTNKIITQDGYNTLIKYDFKGNIRELENIIERIVISNINEVIDDAHISEIINPTDVSIKNLLDEEEISLKEAVNNFERELLMAAFRKYKTTRKVGGVLKIDQSTVVKKAKKLNIKLNR